MLLNSSKAKSYLDCTLGYHHIALSPKTQKKSAFATAVGKFEFEKVSFAFVQTPVHFQQVINEVWKGINFAFWYLDDILIYSRNGDQHLKHLQCVFQWLRSVDLKLKEKKCNFFQKTITLFGPFNLRRRYLPSTRKTAKHRKHANHRLQRR